MCTVLLPPGDNPIAVNKYIIISSYIKEIKTGRMRWTVHDMAQPYKMFLENPLNKAGAYLGLGRLGSCLGR